jgi:hypothetical protein
MRRDPDDRRRGRPLDNRRRRRDPSLDRGARFEGGTPEIPGGHACRDEQAEPQRIE